MHKKNINTTENYLYTQEFIKNFLVDNIYKNSSIKNKTKALIQKKEIENEKTEILKILNDYQIYFTVLEKEKSASYYYPDQEIFIGAKQKGKDFVITKTDLQNKPNITGVKLEEPIINKKIARTLQGQKHSGFTYEYSDEEMPNFTKQNVIKAKELLLKISNSICHVDHDKKTLKIDSLFFDYIIKAQANIKESAKNELLTIFVLDILFKIQEIIDLRQKILRTKFNKKINSKNQTYQTYLDKKEAFFASQRYSQKKPATFQN